MNEVKIKVDDKTKTLRFGERLTTGSKYRVVVDAGVAADGTAADETRLTGSLVLLDRGELVAFAELTNGEGELSTNTREMEKAVGKMPVGLAVEFDAILHRKGGAEGENVAVGICRVVAAGGAWTDDTTGALALYKGEKGDVGAAGESAYEVARRNGFEGTEGEWLASLKAGADMMVAEAVKQTKAYVDGIKKSLAQMQYVKCEAESTEEKQVYHKISITKNSLGQPVLSVDPTPLSIEGDDPISAEYFWEALRNIVFFFNGDFRNDNRSPVPAMGASWRDHDRQFGYANFFATSIAANCFKDATTLYYLWLPNVTEIPDYAFYGCTNLKLDGDGFPLPQVTCVGEWSFYNCDQIKAADSTTFPKLSFVRGRAFENCSSMTKVDLPMCRFVAVRAFADIGAITSFKIGYQLTPTHTDEELEKMKAAIRALNWTSSAEADFKSDLVLDAWRSAGIDGTYCNPYVCEKDSLVEVVAPVVDIIYDDAFYSSQTLTNIDVANALYIGNRAFAKIGYNSTTAARFETLSLPKCVGIGYQAFSSTTWDYLQYNCRTVDAPELEYLGYDAFAMTLSLELFNAPKVKVIGRGAFHGCDNLNASTAGDVFLRFPECEKVGSYAFAVRTSDSGKFKFVDLPTCTMIGNNAFGGRSSLSELVVYAMNGNMLVSRASSTDEWDASIENWGLPTAAWSGTPKNHTGVSVHCVNDAGVHIIVGYKDGKWQIVANEE